MKKFLIWLIKLYQHTFSHLCPGCCRYTPTCSQYGIEALQIHGVVKGLYLTCRRILRCHPWGGSGYDPVPPKKEKAEEKNKNNKQENKN